MANNQMSKLDELIQEGEQVRQTCSFDTGIMGITISGEPLEIWVGKSVIYIEGNSPSDFIKERFLDAAERVNGGVIKYFDIMLGSLKAIKANQAD